jgi:hypothetical protein
MLYLFPADDPEFTVEQFTLIDCQLQAPYKPPKHIQLEDFLRIYLVQPWLAEQAVGDVRLEEEAKKIDIARGKKIEEHKGIQTTITDNEAKMIKLKKMCVIPLLLLLLLLLLLWNLLNLLLLLTCPAANPALPVTP